MITRTIKTILTFAVLAAILSSAAAPVCAAVRPARQRSTYVSAVKRSPDRYPYRHHYVKETFGKKALLGVGAGAGLQHARNSPHEWGRGPAGLAKRAGSGFGQHTTKNSIQLAVSRIRHEEFGYQPSGKRGFGPRLEHALASTVVTRKTTTGRQTIATGRISGAVGSGFVSRLWQPARLHTVSSGMASGGISLGMDAGKNVVREFWPEIRHPGRH